MYSLFKEKMKIIGEATFVTQQMYRKIFNSEYNYGLFVLKKERCEQCEMFSNLSESQKALCEKTQKLHFNNKKKRDS